MAGLLIPNAKQQFCDASGVPLAGGFVYFYTPPATTTPKDTWADPDLTVLNDNPIVLDQGGWNPQGGIWGATGDSWRQVVTDRLGNLIWDQITSTPASANSGTLYDLPVYWEGTLGDGEVYPIFNAVRTEYLPVDLAGSIFSIGIAPAADLVITLKQNSTPIGTVTFHTDSSYDISFLAQTTFGAGDQLVLVGPGTADLTGGNIAGTLVFTVV